MNFFVILLKKMSFVKRFLGKRFLNLLKNNLPNLRLITRKRHNGLKTCLGPDNASYKFFFTSFKSGLINKFIQDLKEIDYFIDIGANVGWYSLCAARSSKCQVLSIEPNPNTFITLFTNIKINNLSHRIIVINAAISSNNHNVTITNLNSADQNFIEFNNPNGIKVIPLKLDEVVTKIPKNKNIAIKIDVEGLEDDVIFSGESSLSKRKEIKLIYCEIVTPKISIINKFLNENGFMCIESVPNKGANCVNNKYIRK